MFATAQENRPDTQQDKLARGMDGRNLPQIATVALGGGVRDREARLAAKNRKSVDSADQQAGRITARELARFVERVV